MSVNPGRVVICPRSYMSWGNFQQPAWNDDSPPTSINLQGNPMLLRGVLCSQMASSFFKICIYFLLLFNYSCPHFLHYSPLPYPPLSFHFQFSPQPVCCLCPSGKFLISISSCRFSTSKRPYKSQSAQDNWVKSIFLVTCLTSSKSTAPYANFQF